MLLSLLMIGQIDLRPVEPPASSIPERTQEPVVSGDSSAEIAGVPLFQGDEHLNHLLNSLMEMGFRPVRSGDRTMGSLQWNIDMSSRGYRVEEYRAENVREIVKSLDMETGREELIGTDPMDVSLIIVRDASGKIVDAYLIRRIKHHYRTGETNQTIIIERFVRDSE